MTLQEWCYKNNRQDLLKEWSSKNTKTMCDYTNGSHTKAKWICKFGHEFEVEIRLRCQNNVGCPYCSNHKVLAGFNDLATINPALAADWNYEKNGNLKPTDVVPGSGKRVWWKCSTCGHEWQIKIAHRTHGSKCPKCDAKLASKRVHILSLETKGSLADNRPDITLEWNYEKNKNTTPNDVTTGCNKKFWWKGKCGHEWKDTIAHRTGDGRGCPICAKERRTSFPEQAIFFYIKKYYPDAINTDNDTINMELDIYIPSLRVAIEYDGKAWHSNPKNDIKKNQLCNENNIQLIRVREEGLGLYDNCICIVRTDINSDNSLSNIIKQILSINNIIDNDIDVKRDRNLIRDLYIKSYKKQSLKMVYPNIASEWHPTKNGNLNPEMVTPHSNKTVWWQCEKGHEWETRIGSRTTFNTGCPYCSNHRLLIGFNDLATTNPELISEWNYEKNGNLKPTDITYGSGKKVWWIGKCGHEWIATINSRAGKRKRGCPYCSGRLVIKGINDIVTTNSELLSEWDYDKNVINPEDVSAGSSRKVWWKCSVCSHEWQTSVNKRTSVNKNSCPKCAYKKIAVAHAKKVLCVESKIIYESVSEAKRQTGISKISACCNGCRKTAGGYHWKYLDNDE